MKGLLIKLDRALGLRAALEDRVLTGPSPFFTPAFRLDAQEEAEARAAVSRMRETGAFMAGARISGERLNRLREALAEAYAGRRPGIKVVTNQRTGIIHLGNPLRAHPELLALATDRFLCGVVERYLRRRIVLADVDVRRVPPMNMEELDRRAGTTAVGYTSSHWHRDVRGRQVKIMFYLTDVTERDSNFVFLPGTHKGHHVRPRRIEDSRFSDEWVRQCGVAPVECYGPSGTAMVFDTNFVHRLRRKPTSTVRDSVTFYYTVGQEARLLDVEPGMLAQLPDAAQALFGGRRDAITAQAE